ncbi:MAG: NAD(P)H-binding protein [Bacteroidia bacterium]|nr:NAD(P)H-binding protein [Bacteroidia bacterium]
MKVALFGATGGTGIEFIKQSATQSIELTAFARNPDKLKEAFPDLRIVRASIDDADVLKKNLQGFDAVVSLVGIAGILQARKPNALYERTARSLVQAARDAQIQRLVAVTSGGIFDAPNEPWFFRHLIKPLFLKNMYEDMKVMESIITASSLQYTLVRPPQLTNGNLTQQYRTITDTWFDDDKDLSRADLAHYLLNCLNDPGTYRKAIGISY